MQQEPVAHQASPEAAGSERRRVLVIGLLSGVLQGAVYFAQRAIYLNGLERDAAGITFQGGVVQRHPTR